MEEMSCGYFHAPGTIYNTITGSSEFQKGRIFGITTGTKVLNVTSASDLGQVPFSNLWFASDGVKIGVVAATEIP
ncbi:unnamed protein product [Allacma fusca]|uniref:Uncharacterized protein n=1 Tax=Allacma fusca TaxID=39272 RepID=A0A8J2PV01_9HEXA|nr:unnamed protein product [Allacma fusca]